MKHWGPKLYRYLLDNVDRQGVPTLQYDKHKKKLSNTLLYAARHIPFYKAYKNAPFALWPTVDENMMRENKELFLLRKKIWSYFSLSQSTENISVKETKFLQKKNKQAATKPILHFNNLVGYTCIHQRLCFPKNLYWIEKAWVDDEKKRFIPVITTLRRRTHILIRFRLNQIFMEGDALCECSEHMWVIEKNISTAEEILYLPHLYEKQSRPIFLDQIERFFRRFISIQDFQIVQQSLHKWLLKIKAKNADLTSLKKLKRTIKKELENFLTQNQVRCPEIKFIFLDEGHEFSEKNKVLKEYNALGS